MQFDRWSTVLFRYYLLGGNTVVPSGQLARLGHTFLVSIILGSLIIIVYMGIGLPVPASASYLAKIF